MIALAVDDEILMLHALVKAVSTSTDITSIYSFTNSEEALDYIKKNPVDIAFLDINMRGMSGLSLAENILEIYPDCKIIFCTGYEEYAISAFKIHASGYLLKPISASDVQKEIDNIKKISLKQKVLMVKCFGNFEVYVNDEMLNFKRSKTKELLAFLIDRNGSGMTAKQICATLFPYDTDDNKNSTYLRQLVLDLKTTLKSYGVEVVLCHKTPYYSVDTSLIKCDYYNYLKTGKPDFYGEYMTQYSWAEETCSMLQFKKNYE